MFRRRNRPQRYPNAMRFSSNGYFFFFLAVFFAFFAFFAFLAMLPSVIPKVGLMQVVSTCTHSKYTTIAKLILNAPTKVNERRAAQTTTKPLGLAVEQTVLVTADEVLPSLTTKYTRFA